jgi:hypothetical protein
MAAAAGTAAVPSAAALEATGRRARDPRVRAGGSRVRTVHRPTWPGLRVHPSRTRPTARVCTEGRFDLGRAHAAHGGRPSCSRGGCPRTVRRSSYNTGGCTPCSARHRDGHPQPCCTPVTRTLAHTPALGAPGCGPCGGGTRAWSTPLACAQGPCMDRGRGRRPSPKPSSTLVGPQQRARAHHEEQPGDAASFGEGGCL